MHGCGKVIGSASHLSTQLDVTYKHIIIMNRRAHKQCRPKEHQVLLADGGHICGVRMSAKIITTKLCPHRRCHQSQQIPIEIRRNHREIQIICVFIDERNTCGTLTLRAIHWILCNFVNNSIDSSALIHSLSHTRRLV